MSLLYLRIVILSTSSPIALGIVIKAAFALLAFRQALGRARPDAVGNAVENWFPFVFFRLAKKPHSRIPGAVVAPHEPAPIGHMLQCGEDRPA